MSRLIYSAPLLPRRRIEKARWCMFQSMRRRRPHPLLPTPKNRPAAPNSAHRSRKSRLRVTAPPTPTDVAVVLTAVVAMRRFRRSKKKPLKTGFEKLCRFAAGAKGQSPGPHILVDGGRSPLHSDRPLIPAPAAPAALPAASRVSAPPAPAPYSAPRPSSPALPSRIDVIPNCCGTRLAMRFFSV